MAEEILTCCLPASEGEPCRWIGNLLRCVRCHDYLAAYYEFHGEQDLGRLMLPRKAWVMLSSRYHTPLFYCSLTKHRHSTFVGFDPRTTIHESLEP